MGLLEALLISLVLYAGGYTHSYVTRPVVVCKEIALPNISEALVQREANVCFEGYDNGIIKLCNKVPLPRMVVGEEEGKQMVRTLKERRLHLKLTRDVIDEYNKNKSVER